MLSFTSQETGPVARVPFFTIDGVEYTHPAEVPASVGLEFMERIATIGEVPAVRWLLIEVIGQEGYDALRQCKGLTRADFAAIQKVVRDLVLGDMEGKA